MTTDADRQNQAMLYAELTRMVDAAQEASVEERPFWVALRRACLQIARIDVPSPAFAGEWNELKRACSQMAAAIDSEYQLETGKARRRKKETAIKPQTDFKQKYF